jgi:flagellar basal-body rod protein FlgB
MADVSMLQVLSGYLKVASDRQQVIVANMANVDTPGYHTRDINFHQAMQEVMNPDGEPQLESTSLEIQGLPERADGNNVNIDRESMLLSETQLQYQMGVELIKERFHTLLTAMKD